MDLAAMLMLLLLEPQAADERTRALERLVPGERVRVRAAGLGDVQGVYEGIKDGTLVVRGETSTALPIDKVEAMWVRRTGARRGAVILGSVGAVAGALLGALGEVVDCEGATNCFSFGPVLVGAGVLGTVGALSGAVFGAATSHWERHYPGRPSGRPGIGEVSGSLGVGWNWPLYDDGGWNARAELGASGRSVELGLELAAHRQLTEEWDAEGRRIVGHRSRTVMQGGPVLRLVAGSRRWRPYLVAGTGLYEAPRRTGGLGGPTTADPQLTLGASLGAGVRGSAGAGDVGLEVRWHAYDAYGSNDEFIAVQAAWTWPHRSPRP